MHRYAKRILSAILCLSMFASFVPVSLAQEISGDGMSYFDFEASEYEVKENAGELKIKIVRHGDGSQEADVTFKIADFLSNYGSDYFVLDENGNMLEKVYGEKPNVADFKYEGDGDDIISSEPVIDDTSEEFSEEENSKEAVIEEREEKGIDEPDKEVQPQIEEVETSIEENLGENVAQVFSDEEISQEPMKETPVNENKKKKSTGYALLDAQAEYLNLPESASEEEKASQLDETLGDFYSYFVSAEGAEGTVHFGKYETEKTVTVKVVDNDAAESDKIFMIALLGTNSDNTTIAANASTYVTILDDEPLEDAWFDLAESEFELTEENTSAYVTVRRSSGLQYFSTVYFSTIKQTANTIDYKNYDAQPVVFIPGETEKKVKIVAYDFSENAEFGVMIEGKDGTCIGNGYADVYIGGSDDEERLKTDSKGSVSLMASGITIGSETKSVSFSTNKNDWKIIKKGSDDDNKAEVSSSNLMFIKNYDKDDALIYTAKKQNLIGVKSISFSAKSSNANNKGKKNKFTANVATDDNQEWNGIRDGYDWNGIKDWFDESFALEKSGDYEYIRFGAKALASGKHNIYAQLKDLKYKWAKYTLSLENSCENFNRKVYDFTSGKPNIYDTYYDGDTSRIYNPGSVVVKSGKDTVNAFYPSGSSVVISAADKAKNNARGIYLKGVYFASSSMNSNSMCVDGAYTDKNVYYVGANENNEVIVNLNQSFMTTLKGEGVISNSHSDQTIKIFPVFGQKYVNVNFENVDRDDSKSATKGKYNASYLCSHIKNVVEASNADKNLIAPKVYQGLEHYQMRVPLMSVIRVESSPVSNRKPSGISVWKQGDSSTNIVYYEKGKTKFSATNASGDTIEETDYTKADIVADKSLTVIKPATGEQTFYVGYSPMTKNYILNLPDPDNPNQKLVTTLKNAVIDTTDGLDAQKSQATNDDGTMWLAKPYIGKQYTFSAYAPDGYYVTWANMTGDANNNGIIENNSEVTSRTNRDRSKNPTYIHGSKISVTLDNDDTRYYYEFLPKSNESSITKRGSVLREQNTLYNLAKGVNRRKYSPISNAQVNIAGFYGQTDGFGNYAINIAGLPSWGVVSATIYADGSEYFAQTSIEDSTSIILPALEVFKAEGASANYDSNSFVADDYITITNDMLTINATVSSSSLLKPKNARFYVYSDSGLQLFDCSAEENVSKYTTTTSDSGGKFTASLRFNPKKDLKNGYRIYVSFADQNGKWYAPIDIGYTFFEELTLDEFVFPLIGSSSLEDVVTTGFVTDIIGNPLGDISLGTIKDFEYQGGRYTPDAAKNTEYEDAYTWNRLNYTYGWSDSFGGSMKTSKDNNGDTKMKKMLNDVNSKKQAGTAPSSQSKFSTQSKFSWSVSPSVGFSITLSQRNAAEQKYHFEDLIFFVKVGFGVSTSNKIALPIGLSVAIDASLSGDVTGVYHMYVDYQDSFETEDAVEYATESFGLFKKFNNSTRREGYIFLNPKVSIAVGVGVAIAFVKIGADFDFDMDFQFTEIGTNAYGDVTINLKWNIDVAGFTVYEKSMFGTTEKMFNTDGTNVHIDFDYANTSSLMSQFAQGSLLEGGEFSTTKKIDRSYLKNRSEWLGANNSISLMSADASKGSVESTLRSGTTDNPYMSITKINDNEMLMVFTDDAVGRTDVNKRAVYYSIGDGRSWSEPVIIDDDGTFDDYPNVQELGNGKIIVSWSSADKVHDEDADLITVLSSLDIKTVFFDKGSKSFGDVVKITKTTDEDKCADLMPKAAYDNKTDRIIMYYTKIEYDRERIDDQLENLTKASVTALVYRFYEGGRWNDETDYTDGENLGEEYKTNWYGQRFLYPTVGGKTTALNVIDSDVIGYNGLSLYAWTVDWDGDMNTTDDRDVFLQMYDFSRNAFVRIFKMTRETGYYAAPKFARSGNSTYLFIGAQDCASENGEIRYFNVSEIIQGEMFRKTSLEGKPYYELCYTMNSDGEINPSDDTGAELFYVYPLNAAECDSITDYDVNVDSDGKMSLFWTASDGDARQIMASVYTATDEDENGTEDPEPEMKESTWSTPIALTNGGEKVYYSGIGTCVLDGNIYIASGKGNYSDSSATSLIALKHTPYKEVKVTDVELQHDYPLPGSFEDVDVTVTNEGLLQNEEPVIVTLDVNGTVYTADYVNIIPGGSSAKIHFDAAIPTDTKDITIKAYITEDVAKTCKVEFGSDVYVTNEIIEVVADENGEETYVLTADVKNDGNDMSDNIVFNATVGEKVVGSLELEGLGAGASKSVNIPLSLEDSDYIITDGIGEANVSVVAVFGDENLIDTSIKVEKYYDEDAINLLASLTEVKFENDGTYTAKEGEILNIQPKFEGVEDGKIKVYWQQSSDGNVAYVDYSNDIITQQPGEVTLTGIVVPVSETIDFTSGSAKVVDWENVIPSDKIKTVTANVVVESEPLTAKYTVTFCANNGTANKSVSVGNGGTVASLPEPTRDGYTFGGWYSDKALTKPFTSQTNVSSSIAVYAKWIEDDTSSGNNGGSPSGGNSSPSESSTKTPIDPTHVNPFKDVFANDWFYDAVRYAYENELFSGVSEDEFAPNDFLTRAMLVTVLWRAAGMPEEEGETAFADADTNSYYYKALLWAVKNGIVKGITETEFAPNDNITRNQIAAIMYRYALLKGYKANDLADVTLDYIDADKIADWATDAVKFCKKAGIMRGDDANAFNAENSATRAETAAITQRFLKNFKEVE